MISSTSFSSPSVFFSMILSTIIFWVSLPPLRTFSSFLVAVKTNLESLLLSLLLSSSPSVSLISSSPSSSPLRADLLESFFEALLQWLEDFLDYFGLNLALLICFWIVLSYSGDWYPGSSPLRFSWEGEEAESDSTDSWFCCWVGRPNGAALRLFFVPD